MRNKLVICLITLTCILSACSKSKKTEEVRLNKIVLIFDSIPTHEENNILRFPNGPWMEVNRPVLTLKPQVATEQLLNYDKIPQDTLVIDTEADYLITEYRYNAISSTDLIIQNGDTALVLMRNKRPIVSIKNRIPNYYDLHLDSLLNAQHIKVGSYSLNQWAKHTDRYSLEIAWLLNISEKEAEQKYIPKYTESVEHNMELIDSLQHEGLLSKIAYQYFTAKIESRQFYNTYDSNSTLLK